MELTQFSLLQEEVLLTITTFGSILSILSALFIFLSYLWYPSLQSFPYKLIVSLTLSDAFTCAAYIIGMHPASCHVQAGMIQFFSVASVLWTGCFAFNVYQVLVCGNATVDRWEARYHLFVWGMSAVLLFINLFLNSFSRGFLYCWISSEFSYLRILTWYVPLITTMIFNAVIYLRISRSLANQADIEARLVNIRLMQYIGLFVFAHMWALFNRVQNWISPEYPIFFLYCMQAIFSPLQGFFDSCLYGVNYEVRKHYYHLFHLEYSDTETVSFTDSLYRDQGGNSNFPALFRWDSIPQTPVKSQVYYSEKDVYSQKDVYRESTHLLSDVTTTTRVVEGYLTKKGEISHIWKKKYFLLRDSTLLYSENNALDNAKEISLTNNIVHVTGGSEDSAISFQLEVSGRVYFLQTSNHIEQQKWVKALRAAANPEQNIPMSERPSSRSSSGSMTKSNESPLLHVNQTSSTTSPHSASSNSNSNISPLPPHRDQVMEYTSPGNYRHLGHITSKPDRQYRSRSFPNASLDAILRSGINVNVPRVASHGTLRPMKKGSP